MKIENFAKDSFVKKETNDEYHANKEYIGSTSLKLYKQSPLHFKEQTELDTPAIRFGSMYHEFILEPDVFKENYYILDDSEICEQLLINGFVDEKGKHKDVKSPRSTKPYKEWLFAQETIAAGRELVTLDEFKQIETMKTVLFSHFYVRYLLTNGENELSHYTELEGVKVKVKPDSLHKKKRLIADLKTCVNASKDKFEKHSSDFNFHISGSIYCDACAKIYNLPGNWTFIMIAQEKTPPYAFNMFRLSAQAMAIGQYEYELLLAQHKYCQESGIYKGYEVFCDNKFGISEINVPPYNIKEINFYNTY